MGNSIFVDKAKIYVEGGKGGNGCVSFRREKFVPYGGPDGGDGGKGGDVYLVATSNMTTLYDFKIKPHYKASAGQHGKGKNMSGKDGEDLIVYVPAGTVVYKINEKTNEKIFVADLLNEDDKVIVAKGGRGGRGNASFKSSKNTAPKISELGELGERNVLELELKLIADVGIIGLPNAGKSTLLSKLTSAKPKIANYPFTTLSPNLGVCVYKEKKIVFADIPGLIENAHLGKGLGIDFLRHIERTRVLLHLIDINGYEGEVNLYNLFKVVRKELISYSKELGEKPYIVAITKIDTMESQKVNEMISSFKKKVSKKCEIIPVSTITQQNLEILMDKIVELLNSIEKKSKRVVIKREEEKKVIFEYSPEIVVEKVSGRFVVDGEKVRRIVGMTNFEQEESIKRLQNFFVRSGIEKKLKKLGIKEGDKVYICDIEFDYSDSSSKTSN